MPVHVYAPEDDRLAPILMSDRFRHEVTFFATDKPPAGEALGPGEWWIDLAEAEAVLRDGVVRIASPLDSSARAEIELTEEQEAWLEWVIGHGVRRIRLE